MAQPGESRRETESADDVVTEHPPYQAAQSPAGVGPAGDSRLGDPERGMDGDALDSPDAGLDVATRPDSDADRAGYDPGVDRRRHRPLPAGPVGRAGRRGAPRGCLGIDGGR
jgi:hypothetical protein